MTLRESREERNTGDRCADRHREEHLGRQPAVLADDGVHVERDHLLQELEGDREEDDGRKEDAVRRVCDRRPHRFTEAQARGRLRELLASTRPVAENRPVEQLDHPVGNEAAAVVAVVDDHRVFVDLRIEILEQLAIAFVRRVRKMDVADTAARHLVDHLASRLHPIEITKIRLLRRRPHLFIVRARAIR